MANSQLMIRGETNPIRVTAKASTNLSVGNAVLGPSTNVVPIASYNSNDFGSATIGVKQAAAKLVFMGIAADARSSLQTSAGNIMVHTSGVGNMAVKDEAAQIVGALYTFGNGAANGLNDTWESTANASCAVARLARSKDANAAYAELEFFGLSHQLNQG